MTFKDTNKGCAQKITFTQLLSKIVGNVTGILPALFM